MNALTFVVLSFAAYRASRAVTIDSITRPFRDWLELRSTPIGHWFDQLFHCGWCTGFWLSGVTYFVWVLVTPLRHTPVMVHLINWWAVAGLQALLIAIDTFFLREAPTDD